MASEDLAISVRGVYKKYGRGKKAKDVLKGLNMEVPYNTIFGLLGASGCGKTTLLRCILSSLEPDYGEITVLGMEPGIRSSNVPGRDVGYMPQDVGLIVEFNALELMMFFGAIHRMPLKMIKQKVQSLVELLEMPSIYQRIGSMSGGEQRRVSFAVALLQDPSLLILDEPTVGLDPLLRVKIWRHLVNLTTSRQSTVILTTHYIEEAKMAHTVGLMRGGVLLAQSSPTSLLKDYNAVSLEAVFLKLAYQSSQRDNLVTNMKPAEVTTDIQQPKIKRKRKLLNYNKIRVPKPSNILTLAAKNLWKICKTYAHLILLLLMPVLRVIFATALVGNGMKDVKLLSTNNDNMTYSPHNVSFSHYYLENLGSDIFDLRGVSSYDIGKKKIHDGDAWGTLLFKYNYTPNVIQRYRSTCLDIMNNTNNTEEDLIHNATILFALDSTDRILSQLSENELLSVANGDLIGYVSKVITNSTALHDLNVNLNVTRYVYGTADFTFRDFFAPGTAASSVFQVAIISSGTFLVLERQEGILDRTYVAGVTKAELILSELVLYSFIGVVQVAVVMTIVFAIFSVQMRGSILLAGFIYWLISLSGLTVGIVASAMATELISVIFMASFLTSAPSALAGVVWPLEGLPDSIQWISNLMPITYPVIAIKAVVSKGMGIGDRQVYEGILITFGWLFLYLLLAILIFHR